MSKKANPTKIGLFIVIAMVLAVGGLILFSSSRLFSSTRTYVLYFDTSVKGLNPGAPVKLHGVTVGTVKEVRIRYRQATHDQSIPVFIEINDDLVQEKSDSFLTFEDEAKYQTLVKSGLRGLLQAQSLVTGLLYVELEFLSNAPEPHYHQLEPWEHREIPTTPTEIQQLMDNIARLDLAGISDKLNLVLEKLDSTLNQIQLAEISYGLTNLLVSANHVLQSSQLTNLLASLQETVAGLGQLSASIHQRVDPFADSAQTTLADASEALEEIRQGVQVLRDMLAPQAPLRRDLTRAVDDLGNTARSVGALAEFLTRNPNALISGRKQTDKLAK